MKKRTIDVITIIIFSTLCIFLVVKQLNVKREQQICIDDYYSLSVKYENLKESFVQSFKMQKSSRLSESFDPLFDTLSGPIYVLEIPSYVCLDCKYKHIDVCLEKFQGRTDFVVLFDSKDISNKFLNECENNRFNSIVTTQSTGMLSLFKVEDLNFKFYLPFEGADLQTLEEIVKQID